MVARQEWFAAEVRSQRHHHPVRARRPSRREKFAARLEAEWSRLVCIQGEANAWPARAVGRPEPEVVHWVAHRPATGETYEAVVAPRQLLAPSTSKHVALSEERLRAGGSVESWHRSWRAFMQPGDLLVQWGHYYSALAAGNGLALSEEAIDLRPEVSQILKRRLRSLEDCLAGLALPPAVPDLPGRGGRRLAALVDVVKALRAASLDRR